MKNKIVIIFLTFIFNLSYFNFVLAEEFTFNVTDLEILESNTVYKGNNRGKILTDTKVELISDNFVYLKKINRLEVNGDVQLTDNKSNIVINAEKMFYLKSEEIIYTLGKTLVNVEGKYKIEGYDLTLFKKKMILSSSEKATITDNNSNIYKLNQFQYSINQEILKGDKINFTRKEKANKEDAYYFESGFFNLKENKFLGKDVAIKFHKTLFNDVKNDPRINATSGKGDKFNTYLNKAVFTSCKKTDKCPPWKMTAKEIHHDKNKKQITYKKAWLELYDFPVAYFPKFFHPDPSVKRQSGLLKPEIGDHSTLGDSIYLPYFFVVSDDKDITLKPRIFNDNKIVLQTEYRQKTKNSRTIIDSSITTGHASVKNGKKATRSHLFTNTYIDLNFNEFINSNLEINYEKISNDNYLKLFDFIKSPLWKNNKDTLESKIKLDLEHENYDFRTSVGMFESLNGRNSDRYTYVLPEYSFSKNFFLNDISGGFYFGSNGNNIINNTNVSTSTINNDLIYSSNQFFSNNGIKTNFSFKVKNINSMSDNSVKYKNTPQSELMSAYYYNALFPLKKNKIDSLNTLTPQLSFRVSPHDMKNNRNTSRRIDVQNVFLPNRLNLTDSFETGESLTLGVSFKKDKVTELNEIAKIEKWFDWKLATVLRFNNEKHIPKNSTINKKASNIFGLLNYKPIKNIQLDYNFSLTNDFDTLEYNAIGAEYNFNNFSTRFEYIEESGILGNTNVISNATEYNFNEYNSLTFSTRRNRLLNLTEYYDVVYEYKNDCLIAGIKYRKDYYRDSDIIPKEELFFSITIVPFYTFSPDKMILNKDRKS